MVTIDYPQRHQRGPKTSRLATMSIRTLYRRLLCSIEAVDRSIRNDLGCWMALAGAFRWMDLTGIPAYGAVMEDLNKELCNSTDVPELMKKVVADGALGVANAKGFYEYSEKTAKQWEEIFVKFSYDIRKLSLKYPQDIGD
jgi:3-hydroxybutyryl-CoA dehydrogenase